MGVAPRASLNKAVRMSVAHEASHHGGAWMSVAPRASLIGVVRMSVAHEASRHGWAWQARSYERNPNVHGARRVAPCSRV